jgi:MinD-like ATPase involved in chromosome partitioning or flagellar assembly
MAFFVTFYSFKGGVGRTLALANVAWSLADSGKKVVLIDLDLEAPALLDFAEFKLGGKGPQKGFLEYAARYADDGRCPPIHEHVHPCRESPGTGQLWVMPSGEELGESYAQTLAHLPWRRLHPYKGTQPMIEGLRQALNEEIQPDYVLIDSRTGFSDVGGLST